MDDPRADSLVCFEDADILELAGHVFPFADRSRWRTLTELAARAAQLPIPSAARRLTVFRELLESEAPQHLAEAERWLLTIESLRESLILTHQDVDYCLSVMAATPRSHELGRLLHRYLDSELAADRTRLVWEWIEKLKNFSADAPAADLWLVQGRRPTALLGELAGALRASPSAREVHLVQTADWAPIAMTGSRWPVLDLRAAEPVLLTRLAEHIDRALQRGLMPEAIRLSFGGDAPSALFLRLALRHRDIPCAWFLDDKTPDPTPAARSLPVQTLASLTQVSGLALRERLRLAGYLARDAGDRRHRPSAEAWAAYLKRLAARESLSREEVAALEAAAAMTTSPTPEPAAAKATTGVRILPWHTFAATPGSLSILYAGPRLVDSLAPTLFSPSEAEALRRAGFPVPTPLETRAQRMAAWRAFQDPAPGRRIAATALPADTLPPARRSWRLRAPISPAPPEPAIRDRARLTVLSATQLETYARCPAKAYFSHRLRLRTVPGEMSRSALLYGQATHAALEAYFSHPDPRPEPQACFAAALAGKAPGLEPSLPLAVSLRAQFGQVAGRLPQLESECQLVTGGARPRYFEHPFTLDIDGLRLRGTIDRIDRRDDGTLFIVDYKTGSIDFTPQHIAEGAHFQALVYLLAVESLWTEPCAGVIFYDLREGQIRRGWLRADRAANGAAKAMTRGHVLAAEKFEEIREAGLASLRRLAAAMALGDFEARPSVESCGFCEYGLLCRRSATHA
jgi:RecB family exonuclease